MTTTGYEFWRAKLAGIDIAADLNRLEYGFWQLELQRGPPHLIAIFPKDGVTRVVEVDRQGRVLDINPTNLRLLENWPHLAGRPVSEADYRYFMEHHCYPAEIEPLPAADPRQQGTPLEMLTDEIAAATAAAMAEIKDGIESQIKADRAANHRDRLLALMKRCEVAFKADKTPHEEALQAVRAAWRPPMLTLDNAITFIRNALTPFLRAQKEAAQRAAGEGVEVKAKAGTGKRRTGLRTQVSARIVDWPAAALALIDNADLRTEIQRLANKVYVGGGTLPGCEKVETEKAQ
jgi:hypothetical protein